MGAATTAPVTPAVAPRRRSARRRVVVGGILAAVLAGGVATAVAVRRPGGAALSPGPLTLAAGTLVSTYASPGQPVFVPVPLVDPDATVADLESVTPLYLPGFPRPTLARSVDLLVTDGGYSIGGRGRITSIEGPAVPGHPVRASLDPMVGASVPGPTPRLGRPRYIVVYGFSSSTPGDYVVGGVRLRYRVGTHQYAVDMWAAGQACVTAATVAAVHDAACDTPAAQAQYRNANAQVGERAAAG
jgi:hypothetical protein